MVEQIYLVCSRGEGGGRGAFSGFNNPLGDVLADLDHHEAPVETNRGELVVPHNLEQRNLRPVRMR